MTNIVSQVSDLTFGQGSELVRALVRQGMNSQAAQRLIEDKSLAAKVVSMLMDIRAGTTAWDRAVSIMGDKAIEITVASRLGLNIQPAEVVKYYIVPFSETELEKAVADGLFLVAMPGTDLLKFCKAAGSRFYDQSWYNDEKFTKIKSRRGYHLLGELEDSTSKNFGEPQAMIPTGYEVPLLVEMTYLAAAKLPGEAFPDVVRCLDVDSDGDRCNVRVGEGQVYVSSRWDSNRLSNLGVAFGQFRPLAS